MIYKVSRVKIDNEPHIVFAEVESRSDTGMYIETQKESVRYRLIALVLALPQLKVIYNDDPGDYISYRRLYNSFKKQKKCIVLKVDDQGRITEGFCKTYGVCTVTEESNPLVYNTIMKNDKF